MKRIILFLGTFLLFGLTGFSQKTNNLRVKIECIDKEDLSTICKRCPTGVKKHIIDGNGLKITKNGKVEYLFNVWSEQKGTTINFYGINDKNKVDKFSFGLSGSGWSSYEDVCTKLSECAPSGGGGSGTNGADGADGISCWDTNGNGTGDVATEDTNGDGVVNIADCQGATTVEVVNDSLLRINGVDYNICDFVKITINAGTTADANDNTHGQVIEDCRAKFHFWAEDGADIYVDAGSGIIYWDYDFSSAPALSEAIDLTNDYLLLDNTSVPDSDSRNTQHQKITPQQLGDALGIEMDNTLDSVRMIVQEDANGDTIGFQLVFDREDDTPVILPPINLNCCEDSIKLGFGSLPSDSCFLYITLGLDQNTNVVNGLGDGVPNGIIDTFVYNVCGSVSIQVYEPSLTLTDSTSEDDTEADILAWLATQNPSIPVGNYVSVSGWTFVITNDGVEMIEKGVQNIPQNYTIDTTNVGYVLYSEGVAVDTVPYVDREITLNEGLSEEGGIHKLGSISNNINPLLSNRYLPTGGNSLLMTGGGSLVINRNSPIAQGFFGLEVFDKTTYLANLNDPAKRTLYVTGRANATLDVVTVSGEAGNTGHSMFISQQGTNEALSVVSTGAATNGFVTAQFEHQNATDGFMYPVLAISSKLGGSASDGFGTKITFSGDDTNSSGAQMGDFGVKWHNATNKRASFIINPFGNSNNEDYEFAANYLETGRARLVIAEDLQIEGTSYETSEQTINSNSTITDGTKYITIDASVNIATLTLPALQSGRILHVRCSDDTNGCGVSGNINGVSQTINLVTGEALHLRVKTDETTWEIW